MRVKEIERTANVAWSPASHHPIYIVAGTAAQQLDATFSTSAALEVYKLNLSDPSLEMPLVASLPSECRFHKLVWGSHGMTTNPSSSGVIVGGADNGSIFCYDAAKLIKGEKNCLNFKQEKHTGAVKALDFNHFQTNLLASGASESEIHIWDLNKYENPMTPGAKSQPPEEVACVSWNHQVQHILASTFNARCVVWDLRKNEPIIKISESMSRMKSKMLAWHPDVATQLCLSSEDDHTPIIQLWDLRYATSPVKVLENHTRGILDIAWCKRDADLLLSCGKDNRILCWNPNSSHPNGEVIYELPTSNQWSFDVKWCPRNPAIISSSSFEGHVTMYSLMGGGHPITPTDKIATAFSSDDPFAQAAHAHAQAQQSHNVMPLQKPPKWLRRPMGASFAFGGKLVSFENPPAAHGHQQQPGTPTTRAVTISQVVTEVEIMSASKQLEQALANGQYVEFCAMKSANTGDTMQENIWNFLRVNFEKEPREHYIQLLGYDKTDLAKKVASASGRELLNSQGVDATELAEKMSQLDASDLSTSLGAGKASSVGSKTPGSREELAGSSAFDEIAANQQKEETPASPLEIAVDEDADGLMSQALLMGNFEAAVDICLAENKMAEAILLAIAGGPELLSRTQERYFQINKSNLGRLISSIVTHQWSHIVETCDLENWKEALTIILTYASQDEFATLCDALAHRLETEKNGSLSVYASLCYICSGNVDKFVGNWYRNAESSSPLSLQDIVEKVMILRKAVAMSRGFEPDVSSGILANKLNKYSSLLAAQGSLETALQYLGSSTEDGLAILKDRLYRALPAAPAGIAVPAFPFHRTDVLPEGARQPAAQVQQQTQQRQQQQHRAGGMAGSKPSMGQSFQPTAGYQSQAGSSFQTNTSPAFMYGGTNQYINGSVGDAGQFAGGYGGGQRKLYDPTAMASTTSQPPAGHVGPDPPSPSPVSKGPLSHKYPSYPQSTSAYGVNTYNPQSYYQPSTNDPAYSQTNYYGETNSQPGAFYNPTTVNPGATQTQPSNMLPPTQSFMESKPKSAWNDPPILSNKSKKASQPQESKTAITSPLYGNVPAGTPSYPTDSNPGFQGYYNPQQHQNEIQQPTAPPAPAEPPKEVVKQPIPPEHQVLHEIFTSLVHNCSAVASHAQMKRKLDDVSKKLELLYDRLREESLSPNVLLGLHQIVQAVQQGDYNTGLAVYTQMVSQGNFSEISSFMPGLKMLLQSAAQMQVYVQ